MGRSENESIHGYRFGYKIRTSYWPLVRRSLSGRSNNPIEVLFGRVLKNPDPILQAEMGQFGRKLIHIYKKLFEDLKSAIDQRKEKPELPDDCD